jgi:sporulation protein YlmC with PRC-barrel domain
MHTAVLSASTLSGDSVVNPQGEDLGKIEDIMIDLNNGQIAYAVLSFGGFMGMGDKLFALPWKSLSVDEENKRVVLDITK